MNRAYLDRVTDYYSYCASTGIKATAYVAREGGFIKAFPPVGDFVRDCFDEAARSSNNPWGICDNERCTREIQSVSCSFAAAEDHTHQVTKNYYQRKEIGANALWDIANESGQIASAVLVPTTKLGDLSHAAIQVSKRTNFNPKAIYSDRWPSNKVYWEGLFPNVEGRLGLFHYVQRIIKTLRKTHTDYYLSITVLLDAVCRYNHHDHEQVIDALWQGTLGGKEHMDREIINMKNTKVFRK